MQPSSHLSPLASAELEIERATVAAWLRIGQARTMADQLQAAKALSLLPALRTGVVAGGAGLELIRFAGLQAVRAAMEDDDMQAMQMETAAAVNALGAACMNKAMQR